MWYGCQWGNSPQVTKMTHKLTTIGHHVYNDCKVYMYFKFGLSELDLIFLDDSCGKAFS